MQVVKVPLAELVEEITRANGASLASSIKREIEIRSRFDRSIDPASDDQVARTLAELEQLGRVKLIGDEWDWIPPARSLAPTPPKPTKPQQKEMF